MSRRKKVNTGEYIVVVNDEDLTAELVESFEEAKFRIIELVSEGYTADVLRVLSGKGQSVNVAVTLEGESE